MLEEIIFLIKMLFGTSPRDIKNMNILVMKYFPLPCFTALSWCGHIIVRDLNEINKTLMNHEAIHLRQAQISGTWIKYYISYLIEWFKGNPFKEPYMSAYYTNPYEMEAYANEEDQNYINEYNKININKYFINDRKTTYIKQGENFSSWKKYIKTI